MDVLDLNNSGSEHAPHAHSRPSSARPSPPLPPPQRHSPKPHSPHPPPSSSPHPPQAQQGRAQKETLLQRLGSVSAGSCFFPLILFALRDWVLTWIPAACKVLSKFTK